MKTKTLSQTNTYLKRGQEARQLRIRCIASSTAIETGEPVAVIEARLNEPRPARHPVTLA